MKKIPNFRSEDDEREFWTQRDSNCADMLRTVGYMICFDADFPALIRQAGRARVGILLVPANNWQPVHTLHARVATFHAVENGVALVRATGNGLAIAVDDLGQTLAMADYYVTDKLTMVVDAPTQGRDTLYAHIGDSFAYLCIMGVVALTLLAFFWRRVQKSQVARGTPAACH